MTPAVNTDLLQQLKAERFVLAPDIVLTPAGPQADHALVVANGVLEYVGAASALPAADTAAAAARSLPGFAVVPGFVDAHTHLAQTFGKILIGGEPAQIWRRNWPARFTVRRQPRFSCAPSRRDRAARPPGTALSAGPPRRRWLPPQRR